MNCAHLEGHDEAAALPPAAALAHFDECLTPDDRLQHWTHINELAEMGSRCWVMQHNERLHELQGWRP